MNKVKTKSGQLIRCAWVKKDDLLYEEYHDREWGVPRTEDQYLFEHLVLESAQAGLSWITILRKRENYRQLFGAFDPAKVALFDEKTIENLLTNPGIIRNRAKIVAAINNAKCFMKIQKEFGSFYNYSMEFVGGSRILNAFQTIKEIPPVTPEASCFASDLKKRGFKFLGPTTVYAHMQAVGMVNDHTIDCFRYQELNRKFDLHVS